MAESVSGIVARQHADPEREALLEDQQWFDDNLDLLIEEHHGKIVAIVDKGIVAVASTFDEVADEVGRQLDEGKIRRPAFIARAGEYTGVQLPL